MVSALLITSSTGFQLSIQKEIAGLLIAGVFIVWWIWKYNKWLAMFVGWIIIRRFLPPEQTRAIFTLSNVLMGSMVYLGIQHLKIDKKKLFEWICYASTLQIIVVFMQRFDIFMFWNHSSTARLIGSGRVWGLFGNSNWSGCFIAMTLPIFLYMAKEKKWYLLGLLGIPALFIMKSQVAIVSGIIGVLFYLYFYFQKKIIRYKIHYLILGLLLVGVVFALFNPIYFDNPRFEVWRRVWKFCLFGGTVEWRCHFVQGWGLGSAYEILPKICPIYSGTAWYQVHNEPLQILLEYGLVGFILMCGLIISTLRKLNSKNLAIMACLIALLIDSLGFFPFRTAPLGFMGVIYLGLIDAIL